MSERSEHEYTVLGHNRVVIGRYLGMAAAAIASGAVVLLGIVMHLADKLGWQKYIPDIAAWPVSAATVFLIVHFCFNKLAWRWWPLGKFLRIPDLNGKWDCKGETLDAQGVVQNSWTAEVTITQTWEKIKIRLATAQSNSHSITAALVYEQAEGYRLMYNYRNEPKIGQPALAAHVGFAELLFDEDVRNAEGDYFNNRGRVTFGKMSLSKKV